MPGPIETSSQTIETAVKILLRAAPPGSEVILFGSHARGQARPNSDLDFLVIEPTLTRPHEEAVRLREALRPLRIAADVLVTSREHFEYWRGTPNTVYFEAANEGRTYGQVA